jgi:hypothetical protein
MKFFIVKSCNSTTHQSSLCFIAIIVPKYQIAKDMTKIQNSITKGKISLINYSKVLLSKMIN